MKTPVGYLHVLTRGDKLVGLDMLDAAPPRHEVPRFIEERLHAYFDGDLEALDAIEVEHQGTEFQRAVWAELRRIPVGKTISYRELAIRVGRPKAMRAVGAANGQNRIAIVVPCHRVIGADGTLTGYAGGLERKRWLLEHERARVSQTADPAANPVLHAAWKL